MKFSELWLRSYVNPPIDSAELAHLLTMAGLEVEALEPVAPDFSGVVVGRVLAAVPHPDADRLRVCQVDAGSGDVLQIVCGAPNVCVDARVPCALVGAKLPGMDIKAAKLRGVASQGMLCSARELGLGDGEEGLLLLPDDAPTGADIRDYLQLDDRIFTLKLTPNRSDCLSVLGIAREVAALTGAELTVPVAHPVEEISQHMPELKVLAGAACPRYCGQAISGLRSDAATPAWMKQRLARSGVRSLGAVVDVTNYVLLETGQPLHAFDAAKLSGAVTVRMAQANESIALLNQQQLALDDDMLVIADDSGPVALAGIMGGAATAVSAETVDIWLESAYFDPDAIAGRARRAGLSTDASYRFERGVDFAATRQALARATQLITGICGGSAGPVAEAMGALPLRLPILLRAARVGKVLGIPFSHEAIERYLSRLGLEVQRLDPGATDTTYRVTPPSYRFDLEIESDLIEELARLYGYDNIPPLAPVAELRMLPQSERVQPLDRLRETLVARDYQEVITYSFVDAAWEASLAPGVAPVALKNPIASQMSVMRSTLLGGLVDVLKTNLNRRQTRVRIMEAGRCYLAKEQGFDQPLRIAGLAYGPSVAEQWGVAARAVDFYDVKADLEALCWPRSLRFVAAQHPALHPGQTAAVWLGDANLGWLGVLHPALVQQWDLPEAPVMFELNVAPLLTRKLPQHGEIPRFPEVRRDLAVIVRQEITAQTLLDAMYSARIASVTEIALFDIYRGKHIDYDKKSLAFRVLMQDNQKTLTDGEVDAIMLQLTDLLRQQFNAQLRS
ncbi:MAG: phenylalanine--tRNA ligase subunit beta [Burkholderiales bacterium]